MNGNRAMQNPFLLDGVNNNTTDNSVPAVYPAPDAIAEFKVQTNAMPAEFGRAAGGMINASIKSGTNQFHGDFISSCATRFLIRTISLIPAAPRAGIPAEPVRGDAWRADQKNKAFFFGDYKGHAPSAGPHGRSYGTYA